MWQPPFAPRVLYRLSDWLIRWRSSLLCLAVGVTVLAVPIAERLQIDESIESFFTDDDPLIELPNAHLAPHLASRTRTAMANMSWVVEDLWGVLSGEQPKHPAPDPE